VKQVGFEPETWKDRAGTEDESKIAAFELFMSRGLFFSVRCTNNSRAYSTKIRKVSQSTHEGHLVVFITVQNLVGIDAVVLIICPFFDFASLA